MDTLGANEFGASRSFVVPGPPVGKQRPRVTTKSTFTPTKTVNYQTSVQEFYAIKYARERLLEGALAMLIMVYIVPPASTSERKRKQMLAGAIRPTKKPDGDNILKSVSDALNGIAYQDDKQIVDERVVKLYGESSRVEVTITKII